MQNNEPDDNSPIYVKISLKTRSMYNHGILLSEIEEWLKQNVDDVDRPEHDRLWEALVYSDQHIIFRFENLEMLMHFKLCFEYNKEKFGGDEFPSIEIQS